jgi:hypothetical protein
MSISANAGTSVPVFQPDETRHRRQIADWAAQVNQGKIQNVGTVTLSIGVLTTPVLDARVGINTYINFMPTTTNALSAEPTVYVSSQSAGGFTITHANSASADKIFRYCVLG